MSDRLPLICIIGGMAADIEGRPFRKLIMRDSNPGVLDISYGGVGRNIGENLLRMGGVDVRLLSVVGDDPYAEGAMASISSIGGDTSLVVRLPQEKTAVYVSILDVDGDMKLALGGMTIFDKLTPAMIEERAAFVEEAHMIVLDGNLSKETLDYIAKRFKHKRLFLDPVSVNKAEKAVDMIGSCYAIKPNIMEAEYFTGLAIKTREDLEAAGRAFIKMGVKKVFISLGKDGLFYMDGEGRADGSCICCRPDALSGAVRPPEGLQVLSATGAGDAMAAAIVHGLVHGLAMDAVAGDGVRAASLTLSCRTTVNPQISKLFS